MSHAWAKDTDWIKANYMTMTNKEMALQLGVHPGTLRVQLHAMNLRRTIQPPPIGKPCPPRTRDLLHTDYVPPKPICMRDGALDYKNHPSRSTGAEVGWHDSGHP